MLEAVRKLVQYLDQNVDAKYGFFVVVLDKRTQHVQEEIKKIIGGTNRFVMGIAIEEIEAWWLADERNTCQFLGLQKHEYAHLRYGMQSYSAETDDNPKKTLHELTELSSKVDRLYGSGNSDLAADFAQDYWQDYANLAAIEQHCPKGFKPFCANTTQAFINRKNVISQNKA